MLLFVTSGMTVYQHYCKGNLIETNLFHPPDFCCGEGSDCCSNEQETFQLDTDYLDFASIIEFEMFEFDIPELVCFDLSPVEIELPPTIYSRVQHPPDNSTALALLQVFCL